MIWLLPTSEGRAFCMPPLPLFVLTGWVFGRCRFIVGASSIFSILLGFFKKLSSGPFFWTFIWTLIWTLQLSSSEFFWILKKLSSRLDSCFVSFWYLLRIKTDRWPFRRILERLIHCTWWSSLRFEFTESSERIQVFIEQYGHCRCVISKVLAKF